MPDLAVQDAYPLARLQAGMLYHAELAPLDGTYHDLHSFCLEGPLDEAAARRCLDILAARHDVLRTSFDTSRFSEPIQLVHRAAEIPLEVIRRPSGTQDEHRAWFMGRLEAERTRPFDVASAPQLRVFIHTGEPGRFWVTFSFAHAILDGWSVHELVRQFVVAYGELLAGVVPQLTPPRTRFRDFVALERETAGDEQAVKFWADALRELPEPAPIGRSGAATGEVVRLQEAVAPETMAALSRLAGELGVRAKSLLLAAHLRVVAGLAGTDEAVTGLVVNGRPERTDIEEVLGLFLNTLPMPVRFARRSWRSVVRELFESEVELLEHRRFPLVELHRMAGRDQLFDTVFSYHDFRTHRGLAAGEQVRLVDMYVAEVTNFPLSVSFSHDQTDESVHMIITARAGVLEPDVIAGLPAMYQRTLRTLVGDIDGRPADLDLLDAGARRRMLSDWNSTAVSVPGAGRCLHEVFAQSARRSPDAVALRCGDQVVSYRELDAWSDQLAWRLVERGVGRGTPVGVCLGRSVELVAALLAVLKAGGAYVPIDPAYPPDRLSYMVDDAGARLVVTGAGGAARVPGASGVEVLELVGEPVREPRRAPLPLVGGEDLAYIIYTSGSTGRPKGVMVPHRAIVNLLGGMAAEVGLTPGDTLLAVTTICFDIAALEIFGPLTTGGTCILAEAESVMDGHALASLLETRGVSVMQATPSTWRLLLAADWVGDPRLRVLCGGEAFPTDLAAQLVERVGAVWNVYGPTETTVWSLTARVREGDAAGGTIPIGRPIANTRVYVVDPFGQPVPVGVPGELLIGGSGVARGYWNRPELTAARFTPDGFGPSGGGRLYRTGDVVRWLPDGTVEFLGRADNQVKVRGFRIELAEVESELAGQPGVRSCVVMVREDTPGDRQLVGYVVTADGGPGPVELRAALRHALPEHMVPSVFVVLDALPLTDNGKVDRKALPAPDGGRGHSPVPYAPPRDEVERVLTELWAQALRTPAERIGVDDSFFDVGGDSQKAFGVVGRARQRFDVELPLASFLTDPTVAGLAAMVRGGTAPTRAPVLVGLLSRPLDLPELVLVHPLGGHVFGYQRLAEALRGRIRLTAVRARGMEAHETPYRSVPEMAAHYLAELRRERPAGGYYLGGWCLGGGVAHEMAVQLYETGVPAAGLVAISSSALDVGLADIAHDHLALAAFAVTGYRAGGVDEAGQPDQPPELDAARQAALGALRDLDEDAQLARLIELASDTAGLRPDLTTVTEARRLVRIYRAHQHALEQHRPRHYPGRMHLVKPSRCHLPDTADGDLGWGPAAGDLDLVPIDGTHYSILAEPAVNDLADRLASIIW